MSKSLLAQAHQALKAGDRQAAVNFSRQAINQNRDDWRGWWLLAHAVESNDYRIQSLQQVLALNPGYEPAETMLDDLKHGRTPSTPLVDKRKRKPKPAAAAESASADSAGSMADASFYSLVMVIVLIGGLWLLSLAMPIIDEVEEQPITGPPPEEVAVQQLYHMLNHNVDEAIAVTCSSLKDEIRAESQAFYDNMPASVDHYRMDLSGLHSEIVRETPRAVAVQLTGEITFTSPRARNVTWDIEQFYVPARNGDRRVRIRVIEENNRWVACTAFI